MSCSIISFFMIFFLSSFIVDISGTVVSLSVTDSSVDNDDDDDEGRDLVVNVKLEGAVILRTLGLGSTGWGTGTGGGAGGVAEGGGGGGRPDRDRTASLYRAMLGGTC